MKRKKLIAMLAKKYPLHAKEANDDLARAVHYAMKQISPETFSAEFNDALGEAMEDLALALIGHEQ